MSMYWLCKCNQTLIKVLIFTGPWRQPVIEMTGFSFDPRMQMLPLSIEDIACLTIEKYDAPSYSMDREEHIR